MHNRPVQDQEQTLTLAERNALNIVQRHDAIVQVVPDYESLYEANRSDTVTVPSYVEIDELLAQLKDPTTNRPSRTKKYFADDNQPVPEVMTKINLLTMEKHRHEPGKCRTKKPQGHQYAHTAKMASTLLTPKPNMIVFDETWIGFLWDINACKINNKYIWSENAVTDALFWYDGIEPGLLEENKKIQATVDQIRQKNNKAVEQNRILLWNEFLTGFPKGRVDAIFTPVDQIERRTRAWEVMLHVKEYLGLKENIPVLVLDVGKPYRVYTEAEYQRDLAAECLTQAEKNILETIRSHKAMVRLVQDSEAHSMYEDGKPTYEDIDQLLAQIQDPTKNRPSRTQKYYDEQHQARPVELEKINLVTQKWHKHKLGESRSKKPKGYEYSHTAKISASLIPPQPNMRLNNDDWVGFLWDMNACEIKTKYVWERRTNSDALFWYKDVNPGVLNASAKIFSTIEAIREKNNRAVEQHKLVDQNEVLIGVPRGRVDAIFTCKDNYESRLRAWEVMLHVKEYLGLKENIPVLVIDCGYTCRIYTAEEQKRDLQVQNRWGMQMLASNRFTLRTRLSPQAHDPVDSIIDAVGYGLVLLFAAHKLIECGRYDLLPYLLTAAVFMILNESDVLTANPVQMHGAINQNGMFARRNLMPIDMSCSQNESVMQRPAQ